jgi:hypothetical protein
MKFLYTAIFFVFIFSNRAQSQTNVEWTGQSNGSIILQCNTENIHISELEGGVTVQVQEGTPILELGAPDLPKISTSLIVDDTREMTLQIISSDYEDFYNVEVLPSKGNFSRTIDPATVPYTYGNAYTENEFFPGRLASLSEAYIQGQFRGQSLHFFPVQYNPFTKVLRLYHNIEISVIATEALGQNALPANVQSNSNLVMNEVYASHFINYQEHADRYDEVSEIGNMLVIAHSQYFEELQPWIQWKKEKGIPVELVDVADINSIAAIAAYAENKYTNDGLTYLVLVGDEDQVPSELVTNASGTGYCDGCYGYVSGNDHYAEFFVGRFLVHNDTELPPMIDKILEYEKNPDMSFDWFSVALGLGSNEGDGIGDDNQADWQHQNGIKEDLLAFTYTEVWERYDGSHTASSPTGGLTADAAGNAPTSSVSEVINNGCSLINYTGHGNHDIIVTGDFTNTDIYALDNNHHYPYFIIVGCCVGDFDDDSGSGDTFGEAWVKSQDAANPTGGIGGAFSSVFQSWAPPMEGQDEMNKIIANTGQVVSRHTIGSIHFHGCASMNDAYGAGGDDMSDTWVLMADPTMQLRTAYPSQITATHVTDAFFGTTEFTINCNTEDAMVCISFNGEIMGTALVSGGIALVTIPVVTEPGQLLVTASSFNTIPYQGNIDLVPAEGPYVVNDGYTVDDSMGNNNGLSDYNETLMIDLDVTNIGIESAPGVTATLITTNASIDIIDGTETIGDIDPDGMISFDDAFSFVLNSGVEDQSVVIFTVLYTDGNGNTWTSTIHVIINAPEFTCQSTFLIDDATGNDNGRFDSGETAIVTFNVTNTGHAATAVPVIAVLADNSTYTTISNSNIDLGIIDAGETAIAQYTIIVAAGTPASEAVAFNFSYTSDYYGADCDVQEIINQSVEDFESNDLNSYDWQLSGNADWFTTTNQPYEGDYCLESGNIGSSQTTTLQLTANVLLAGDLTFSFRVSSEGGYDFLNFMVDGTTIESWSGELAWDTYTYSLSAGNHVIKWVYAKDNIFSAGSDAAWMDNIILPQLQPVNISELRLESTSLSLYPNPATNGVRIGFNLSQPGQVNVFVDNTLGEHVMVLNKGNMAQGENQIPLELSSLAPGIYWVKVQTATEAFVARMVKQ